MKTQSVSMEETRVVKVYPATPLSDAALHRANTLRAAGIATPAATRIAPDALAFPRIDGRSGTALASDLATLLAPLAALHRAAVPGLAPHDPFHRIRPRLNHAPTALRARIEALETAGNPAPSVTIHGDFHPGQVIAAPDGTGWLIDLDDLAHGAPEADLGNLLAYLLTAPATRDTAPRGGWRDALLAAWGGDELHPANFSRQTEIALIRRALKGAGRGDPLPLDRLMAGGYAPALSGG